MQMFKKIMASVTVAFISCATLTAGTVIYLMFGKATSASGHYTGLFGSVYFETKETSSGGFMFGFGVENPWVFSVIFLVIFAFAMIFQDTLSLVKKRRQNLLENLDEAQA